MKSPYVFMHRRGVMVNYYRYQLRGATQEAWNEANPVLTKNEPGYDQTNNRLKFGDRTTPWNELPYLAPDVVDDLLSLSTTSALSAAQGKFLNDNKLNKSDVIDNLMSASTTSALSAAQGKVLKELIDNAPTGITSVTVNDVSGNWPLNRVSGTLGVGNMDINGLKSNLENWVKGLSVGISYDNNEGKDTFKNGVYIIFSLS